MRAVVMDGFGDESVLRIGEVARPELRPGQVLIRVSASGVNRADLLQRQGHYPPPAGESDVLGLEVSGLIAEVAEGVVGWRPGDPCVALLAGGGYAEFVAVPAGQAIPPPPGVALITAAGMLEVAATVSSNVPPELLGPGRSFLVHGGAGGIGTFALQYARCFGATVITTAGSAAKLDLCRELGADLAVDYHGDWRAEIAADAPSGVDVILDVIGAKYLEANVSLLGPDGQLVVIGLQGGRRGTLDLATLLAKRGTITATSLRGRPADQKAAICRRVLDEVWPLVAEGRIRPAPETRFPLAQVADAHRHLASGENIGKVILVH